MQKITGFISESVDNSFKHLQLYGVDIPKGYTKISYSYVICHQEIIPTEVMPERPYIFSQGVELLDLDKTGDIFDTKDNDKMTELKLEYMTYQCATIAFKKVLEVLLNPARRNSIYNKKVIARSMTKNNKDITIYTDNLDLALTWGLDSKLNDYKDFKSYKKDPEISQLLKRFSNLKLIWIPRESNKIANKLVSKGNKSPLDLVILEAVTTRIKELDNLISTKEYVDSKQFYKDLQSLGYLVEKGLGYTNKFINIYFFNPQKGLVLKVKRKWLKDIKDKLSKISDITLEEYRNQNN